MATLRFTNVRKVYPGDIEVLPDINLDVADGEFIVIVGPSGCGKSTLMRMVAGLEAITSGEIAIDERVVNDLEPARRDIAMVFQNYALYPHMTVFQNMAYGLKIRKFSRREIQQRVDRAATILELSQLLDRRPSQLSGGQRQRVAMGRAIVREPKVFLFDEPLSNLDAKLRVQMRLEIQRLHQRLGTTSLYVTHDQVEAMTLAQRMVVMNKGIAEQVGTPTEVFDRPASIFVASFIGSPPMNLLPCTVLPNGKLQETATGQTLQFVPHLIPGELANRKVFLGIRPEHLVLHATGIPLQVEMVEILGSEQLIHGRYGDTGVVIRCPLDLTRTYPIQPGEAIQAGVDTPRNLHWFDYDTGQRIDVDT
ncbi:MAG TPA: sn-glycerol-3-phosphate import ATP-binding protein UgpC [Burkholderiaceae bacterium]|nr:sn-glycerol-3-phosphate import ATP-binding protein UgpC [Burkholderiaceae bacterium]